MKLEKGRVVNSGMGGFLNPPGHPEHDWHVETDLRRRLENRGGMALSSAVDCKWLDEATRKAAADKLASWEPLPLYDPATKDWIYQVLGYFQNCYGSDHVPDGWNASNLDIRKEFDPMDDPDHHAGVHFIRRFYPDYVPCDDDFDLAYWGKGLLIIEWGFPKGWLK